MTTNSAERALESLLREADHAQRAGDRARANTAFRQILSVAPDHPVALNALGMAALGHDDRAAAAYFVRAADADPTAAPLWMNLASAHRGLGDADAERAALERALATDQRNLMANVRIAELFERIGDTSAAAFRWGGVATIARSIPDRAPALDQLLTRAMERIAVLTQALSDDVDVAMQPLRNTVDAGQRRRFDACVDAMLGRRRIYAPAPHGLHFPFLPADEFFAREHFAWLTDLEAATPAILAELEALLSAPTPAFTPYVTITPGTPANLWSALDRSEKWSVQYLWRYGVRNDAVCARCPQTAAILDTLPLSDIAGRAPTAFFSILKPGTHLPPHTGVSNIRSIVHLPLIVPDKCGFRVGGETREWRVGEAFVFDDTIEHEAWNDSDEIRAVLIVDVWNPYLTDDERTMVRHLFEALGSRLGDNSQISD